MFQVLRDTNKTQLRYTLQLSPVQARRAHRLVHLGFENIWMTREVTSPHRHHTLLLRILQLLDDLINHWRRHHSQIKFEDSGISMVLYRMMCLVLRQKCGRRVLSAR